MLRQMTLEDLLSATSSPESADGLTLSNSQAGPKTDQSGLEVAPANPSALQEKDSEPQTSVISGPNLPDSSPPVSLQSVLESRFQARMAGLGSPEYSLIWKRWDISGQEPICALRASGHRISGKDCSGWATPRASEGNTESADSVIHRREKMREAGDTKTGSLLNLCQQAQLAGWPTTTTRDYKSARRTESEQTHSPPLSHVVLGTLPISSPAETASKGALNPALSRWLMGYPISWCVAAIKAFRLLTKKKKEK